MTSATPSWSRRSRSSGAADAASGVRRAQAMKTAPWAMIVPSLGLALVLAGCAQTMQTASPLDKLVIRVGSPFKPGHILVDPAEKFEELAESRSGGRIAVQIDAGT